MEGTTEIADKKPGKNNQEMINAKAGQVKDWSGWLESWLNDYVKQNVSKGKLKDLSYEEHNRNAVRDAIKEEIRVLIEHIKDEPDGGKPTAELNLKDIQKYLEAVAAAIETHVEPIAAEKLATKIETVSLSISDAAPNTKPYLRGAIEVTLLELSLMIKCFAGELQSFLLKPETDNIAAKIEETYGNAETLNGQLNEATGHPAGSSGKPNHAKNLDEAIEAVKNKAVELTTGDTTAMATLSDQIKSNLVALTGEFAIAGKKVSEQLEKLKKEISLNKDGEGLHKIHKQLKELHGGAVTDALSAAEKFLKPDAYKLRDETIEKLRGQVDKEIENAKKLMIKQAQKIYVTSVKEMLKAFADKVQKELQDLPKQIDKERKEGFKGFMRTVEGKITDNATTDENIKSSKILQKATLFKTLSTKFKEFFGPLKGYLDTEIMRLYKDSNAKKNPPVTIGDKDPHPYADALDAVQSKLNTLLDELHNSNHFTHSLTINLGNLSTALNSLVPTNFEGPCNTLPDVLKVGLRGFHAELEKAYVSVYDGVNFGASLTETKVHADGRTSGKLTTYGTKCAKVFLTLLSILSDDLNALKPFVKAHVNLKRLANPLRLVNSLPITVLLYARQIIKTVSCAEMKSSEVSIYIQN
ncbi:hypothetical protein, conserved [Babesia ovata]|uniref:Extracellular matrix-binding ebh n=1 Tax=Babesia ovata TaxID=189622 RepID=A0A2H6KKE5_9APIC|nr:uncharacterized protein BOVATA_049540 [Babesia ovata]GBE63461.1 hypothetical protein, conserved [Babesia ovata]